MITSTTNAKVRDARKLQRKRYRYAMQQILVEGVRLLQDAVAAGIQPAQVFYAPELVDGNDAAADLLDTLREAGVECSACSSRVLASLTETVTPQGLAGVLSLPALDWPDSPSFVLILDRVRDPGNAGTLLRTAEAAGVDGVLIAPGTVDPFNDKVVRAGMGAHFRLPVRVCANWDEVHRRLDATETFYVADANAEARYDEVDWRGAVALVIGGESIGASPQAIQSGRRVAIPMHRPVDSLNAAVAGAILMFEASRQRREGAS